jgi:SynChlorMet cassette protein ScmC
VTKLDLGLVLADGSSWAIRALDEEAEATVRGLGKVMRLSPGQGRGKLCCVSGLHQARGSRVAGRGLVCRLGPARGRIAEVFKMEQVATAIAVRSLARGGLLLHGALAVRDGAGFILAGPSGIGKSTASRRLPAPWQSFSDDCALVVRDANGLFWAHPWPTWSVLRDHGPVASWPVEQAVPLKALLFLTQSSFDRAEPITATPATALIMESAHHLARVVAFTPDAGANRAVCAKYLSAAGGLAAAVPAFRLRISPTGRFWDEIARAVKRKPRTNRYRNQIQQNSETRNQHCRTGAAEANAELPERKTADDADGRRCGVWRSVPEPPRRLLSESPKPRLIRFRAGQRTFVKLMSGRRVVASANNLLTEWYVRRPSRRTVRRRTTAPKPTGLERVG